jgi:uncharacterized OB-fold protein
MTRTSDPRSSYTGSKPMMLCLGCGHKLVTRKRKRCSSCLDRATIATVRLSVSAALHTLEVLAAAPASAR